MIRRLAAFAPLLLLALTGAALAAPATTKVTYVAGGSIYVEVGTQAGLRVGDTLQVLRGTQVIARLRAAFVSSKRAACDTLWTGAPLQAGDAVKYEAHAVLVAARADSLRHDAALADSARTRMRLDPPTARATTPNRTRIRGRIGGRWLSVTTSDGGSFQQPSLDLRSDGHNVAGGHIDLTFDMRNRRTTRNFSGGGSDVNQQARVYRASMTVRSLDSNHRFTMGRQSSPLLASINLFDGGLVEWGDTRHSVGLFSGTQPDPERYALSGDILQMGGFLEWHQKPLSPTRWSFALGGVTSQQGGQPNRDFFFGQSWWFSKAVTASITQEVDFNRGWKRSMGEPALSPTSTFGSMRVPVTEWFSANTGYDNRRNVRLYRDRLTPETQFDDAYRQGAWAGGQFEFAKRLRFTGESRSNAGSDKSHSWSTSAEANRFAPLHATMRLRTSKYYGQTVDSELLSGSLGLDPVTLWHFEFSGGTRKTIDRFSASSDTERWMSLDMDLTLGRNWYMNGGWEQDRGGLSGTTRQMQAGLSWRF